MLEIEQQNHEIHKLANLTQHESNRSNLMSDKELKNGESESRSTTTYEPESRANLISAASELTDDALLNLPPDWTKLDFKRKKSCILSNIYSTCVTKAINHLEALQISMEKWIEKDTSNLDEYSNDGKSWNEFNEIESHKPNWNKTALKFRQSGQDSLTTSDGFVIQGVGGKLDDQKSFFSAAKKSDLVVIEKKGAAKDVRFESVLEEVLLLLLRLEYDRRRTDTMLSRERGNFSKLKTQIENLSVKRAVELPLKVQQEHDSCIADITELNWHIAFNTKAERKLIRKVEVEERLAEKLKEEIANARKTIPLIEEKIEIELEHLKKVTVAQDEVDASLKIAREKHEVSKDKWQNSEARANKEREAIQAELANCNRELNKAKKRLNDAEQAYRDMHAEIDDCSRKLSDNLAQDKLEVARKLSLRDHYTSLHEKDAFVKTELFRIEKENNRVSEENKKISDRIAQMTSKFNEELDKLRESLMKKEEKLEKIVKKVQEKEIDLEEMARDKRTVEAKIEKDMRNRDRMTEEKEKMEEELKNVKLSHANALKAYQTTVNDQIKEMKRLEQRKDQINKQINDLKKQTTEERNLSANLVARMNAEVDDYQRAQKAAEIKKTQYESRKLELDKRLAEFELSVDDLEVKKIALENDVVSLGANLGETKSRHEQLETSLTRVVNKLDEEHRRDQDEYNKVKERLEFMIGHSSEMNDKINDMSESKKMMQKAIEKTNSEIKVLTDVYNELLIQFKEISELDKKNQKNLSELENRVASSDVSHKTHVKERQEYLERIKIQLEDHLKLNKELASRYRTLKFDLYNVKLDLMNKIEVKLNTHSNLKDQRQLKSLQERMQSALKDYLSSKINYSVANFDELNNEKEQVANQIESLEEMLYNSIGHITRFLHNQMDFSKVRQLAMQKVYRQELIEKNEKRVAVENLNRQKNSKTNLINAL